MLWAFHMATDRRDYFKKKWLEPMANGYRQISNKNSLGNAHINNLLKYSWLLSFDWQSSLLAPQARIKSSWVLEDLQGNWVYIQPEIYFKKNIWTLRLNVLSCAKHRFTIDHNVIGLPTYLFQWQYFSTNVVGGVECKLYIQLKFFYKRSLTREQIYSKRRCIQWYPSPNYFFLEYLY